MPEVILNSLYKLTPMQTSFGFNMLAIVDNQPKVLGLHALLGYFLDHRKTIIVRRSRFDLKKARERAHILEGILTALDHLDEIITTIRASHTPADARQNLMNEFDLSDIQAQAILEMRLQRLTGLEREKVLEEHREVSATMILSSDELIIAEIIGELDEIRETFGDARRTEIIPATGDITIEDMIADEDMVITVTNTGYVKRSPLSLYRAQHRGGKGRTGMTTKEGDVVEQLYVATAHSYVLVFTEAGHVYWLKVHQIPEFGPAARGRAIVNLLNLDADEKVASTVAVRDFDGDRFLFFVTENGTVKKSALNAYGNIRAAGIIAINIDEDDRLLDVRITDGESDVFLATRKGFSIRFPETNTRTMGRATRGVRGISLRAGDSVVAASILAPEGEILTVSESGYGKRTRLGEYRVQGRGGKGIINLKVSDKTGDVVGVHQVGAHDEIILISQKGKLIRSPVADVSIIGRSTQGVKVMDLRDDDVLVATAKIAYQEDDDEGEPAEAPEDEPIN